MIIQPFDSRYTIQSPKGTDFQNFRKSFRAVKEAMQSGNQDQITLSEKALQKAMTQFQDDLNSSTSINSPLSSQPTPLGDNPVPGGFFSQPTPLGGNPEPGVYSSEPTPLGDGQLPPGLFPSQLKPLG